LASAAGADFFVETLPLCWTGDIRVSFAATFFAGFEVALTGASLYSSGGVPITLVKTASKNAPEENTAVPYASERLFKQRPIRGKKCLIAAVTVFH
jgi:hypothetical protein